MTKRAVKRSPLQRRQQVGHAHRGQGDDPSIQGSAPKINQSINQSACSQMHEVSADLMEVSQATTTAGEQWDSGMASRLPAPWLGDPWG